MRVRGIIVVLVLGTPLAVVIILAYVFHVNMPGLGGKNLWDWLQLLIIPAVLAIGGIWFNYEAGKTEREVALDKQREDAMQAYFDTMSELLLKEHLSELKPEYDNIRQVARVRTMTILPRLDGRRKGIVLQFLYESKLINTKDTIIDLNGANLDGAILRHVKLNKACLSETSLRKADLRDAGLFRTNLYKACLAGADLK